MFIQLRHYCSREPNWGW